MTADGLCGVCGAAFEPDTGGQDVCEPCFREAHQLVAERDLLLALEVAAMAAQQAVRDGDMQEWMRQSALCAAVHEDLAQMYGWRK